MIDDTNRILTFGNVTCREDQLKSTSGVARTPTLGGRYDWGCISHQGRDADDERNGRLHGYARL